jgi:uncharacterized RDD family membrane protein YckC/DNA-directed RNA polymerase subunit RPC12/RpoP
MPIKVKCDDCGKGFSVPDEARGKSIKCKGCGGRVQVPKGGPRRKKAARPRKSVADDDFFSSLDLDRAEDQDVQVCQKCAAEVDEDDIECPKCGVNLETGVISEKQKRKHRSKGPDPDEFFKVVWSNPWEFLKKNWSLAIRISVAWSIFAALAGASVFMLLHYIEFVPDVKKDEQRPYPLIAFWGLLTFVTVCSTMGVYWQTFIEMIKATMDGDDELKRFNFDFFTDVALGLKLYVWPAVLMSPIAIPVAITAAALWFTEAYNGDDAKNVWLIVGGCLYVPALLFFPLAISHLTAKYTYKAYTLVHMATIFGANAKATMMWWLVAFCLMLPAAGATVGCAFGGEWIYDNFINATLTIMGYMVDTEEKGFLFKLLLPFVSMPIMFAGAFLFSLLHSFSGVFLMRAMGLYTHYNKRSLNMGDNRQGDQPADFWVRYLQLIVDCFVVLIMTAVVEGIIFGLAMFWTYLTQEDGSKIPVFEQLGSNTWRAMGAFGFFVPFAYFVIGESGPGKGTLGMHGVGIYVIDQFGNSPIEKGPAITRYFIRLFTLGLSGLAMLADKHRRALHDQTSQTHVVWKREVY